MYKEVKERRESELAPLVLDGAGVLGTHHHALVVGLGEFPHEFKLKVAQQDGPYARESVSPRPFTHHINIPFISRLHSRLFRFTAPSQLPKQKHHVCDSV